MIRKRSCQINVATCLARPTYWYRRTSNLLVLPVIKSLVPRPVEKVSFEYTHKVIISPLSHGAQGRELRWLTLRHILALTPYHLIISPLSHGAQGRKLRWLTLRHILALTPYHLIISPLSHGAQGRKLRWLTLRHILALTPHHLRYHLKLKFTLFLAQLPTPTYVAMTGTTWYIPQG